MENDFEHVTAEAVERALRRQENRNLKLNGRATILDLHHIYDFIAETLNGGEVLLMKKGWRTAIKGLK